MKLEAIEQLATALESVAQAIRKISEDNTTKPKRTKSSPAAEVEPAPAAEVEPAPAAEVELAPAVVEPATAVAPVVDDADLVSLREKLRELLTATAKRVGRVNVLSLLNSRHINDFTFDELKELKSGLEQLQ